MSPHTFGADPPVSANGLGCLDHNRPHDRSRDLHDHDGSTVP